MKRVLSGIQPTGNLHLGNYLGAIRNWLGMQDEYDCLYMLADLHAITMPQDPEKLRAATRETAAAFMACGINPEKSVIFPQSAVTEHTELAWILNCHTPLGWLNRMTQFKEKTQSSKKGVISLLNEMQDALKMVKKILSQNPEALKQKEYFEPTGALDNLEKRIKELKQDTNASEEAALGLFAYPVLMAADILIYKATHVPVGEDQKQHLELARDIAGAFNRAYGQEYFPQPEPIITGAATRVMSLRDGTKKMSKSDESDYSRVNLTDDADTIAKKFQKAKSDMVDGISYDVAARPEASNLINIYAALAGTTREKVVEQYGSSQFSSFKKALTDLAVEQLSPITSLMREYMKDVSYIDRTLKEGAEKARAIASKHMKEIKEMVGFLEV